LIIFIYENRIITHIKQSDEPLLGPSGSKDGQVSQWQSGGDSGGCTIC